MKKVFLGLLVALAFGCREIPQEVDVAIGMAGANRWELKKVLWHYGWRERDSLKFRAACFLIGNMRWHYGTQKVEYIDPQLEVFTRLADSAYAAIYREKGRSRDSLQACAALLEKQWQWLADSVRNYEFEPSVVKYEPFADLCELDYGFLTDHIDNAFRQWESSPLARDLSFGEFCEAILPYRALRGYPYLYPGEELNRRYAKYVCVDSTEPVALRVFRYNRAVQTLRSFLGQKPLEDIGIYNLYFHGHECQDVAAYGCSVLRACGVPVMVEFCDAYRDFAGRHYYCVTLDSGRWETFNPESSLPGKGEWVMGKPMNLYRQYYGAQQDAPYFLRAEGEYLPPLFASPCIREITAERAEVCPVTLPFRKPSANRLAYLAAFQSRRDLAPVTWGVVDTLRREVVFRNTMFGRLYFPVYYEGNELQSFGDPFYVERDSLAPQGYRICTFHPDTNNRKNVVITRKFPRKPNMVRVAEQLVGSVFTGANEWDFSDAKLLYTIREAPGPYLQDFIVRHPRAYRYYRYEAPDAHPRANVAMLEFLTDRKYGYTNVMEPSPAAVLCPQDTLREVRDARLVKLLDEPSWDKMKWKAEYDGNMQTAPSGYKTVHMRLKEPQIVERFRFAPKNADNGIHRGHAYELLYWNNGWVSSGIEEARYEYIECRDVPEGVVFWLRNHTEGKEELPFVLRNGQQLFLYYDILGDSSL